MICPRDLPLDLQGWTLPLKSHATQYDKGVTRLAFKIHFLNSRLSIENFIRGISLNDNVELKRKSSVDECFFILKEN